MAAQKTFLDFVEQATDRLESAIQKPQICVIDENPDEPLSNIPGETEAPQQALIFKPKHDMALTQKVTDEITKVWDKIRHRADFERFLDIILAALERREDDYMALIKGMDKKELDSYAKIYSILYIYFLDGNYGDPLGTFYELNFSYGKNGEYYTPWNIAYFMAKIMNPNPEKTLIDPCCGSGIMLLAARCVIHENYGWFASSRYGRNLYGMDISNRAVKMSKINLYLTDYVYMICLINEVVFEFMNKKE